MRIGLSRLSVATVAVAAMLEPALDKHGRTANPVCHLNAPHWNLDAQIASDFKSNPLAISNRSDVACDVTAISNHCDCDIAIWVSRHWNRSPFLSFSCLCCLCLWQSPTPRLSQRQISKSPFPLARHTQIAQIAIRTS